MVIKIGNRKKGSILDGLIIGCTSILFFLTLNPFFIWETYRGGFLSSSGFPLIKVMYFVVIVLDCFYLMGNMKIVNRDFTSAGAILLAAFFLVLFSGVVQGEFPALLTMNMVVLFFTILLQIDLKIAIFEAFKKVFAFLLVPGIVFSVIAFLGINVPHDIILSEAAVKSNNYVQYLHFPFCVQITKSYDIFSNLNRFRLCGVLDEPGRVGTMCAFFLASDKFNLRKNINKILLISGLLSLSVAFILLTLAYLLMDAVINKNKKRIYLIAGLFMGYLIFEFIPFNNIALTTLQGRLMLSSGHLAGDNRTNSDFIQYASTFFHSDDFYNILFGYGSGSTYSTMTSMNNGYSSSFIALFLDYGVVGFIAIVAWPIVFWATNKKQNGNSKLAITLLIINLINLYQRPSAFSPSYLYPFIGGIYILNKEWFAGLNLINEQGDLPNASN